MLGFIVSIHTRIVPRCPLESASLSWSREYHDCWYWTLQRDPRKSKRKNPTCHATPTCPDFSTSPISAVWSHILSWSLSEKGLKILQDFAMQPIWISMAKHEHGATTRLHFWSLVILCKRDTLTQWRRMRGGRCPESLRHWGEQHINLINENNNNKKLCCIFFSRLGVTATFCLLDNPSHLHKLGAKKPILIHFTQE